MPGSEWVRLWLRTLFGASPRRDPWNDDPHIRAERAGQHDRINKATAQSGWDQADLRRRIALRDLDLQTEARTGHLQQQVEGC
jgi:ribosome-binding protein aMBF1 (putative translation factor)